MEVSLQNSPTQTDLDEKIKAPFDKEKVTVTSVNRTGDNTFLIRSKPIDNETHKMTDAHIHNLAAKVYGLRNKIRPDRVELYFDVPHKDEELLDDIEKIAVGATWGALKRQRRRPSAK